MASALQQLVNNYQTETPVDYRDYYKSWVSDNHGEGFANTDPNSLRGKFEDFFYGFNKNAQSSYDNYIAEYDWRRKQAATAEANKQTYAREDSQIQRLMKDYTSSGLNPYLLLNSGNISGGVISSPAQRTEWKRRHDERKENSDQVGKAISSAIKILALIALKGLM